MPSRSSTSLLGLPKVSAKMTFVLGLMAASSAAKSFTFTIVLVMPCVLSVWVIRL